MSGQTAQAVQIAPSGAPAVANLGEAVIGGPGSELVALGLGSCIGLALWSPRQRWGVLCHIVLPDSEGAPADPATPAKYADQAVAWAVDALTARGARREELVAKVAGGARVLALPIATEIGQRNAVATLAALRDQGIPVAGTRTGGGVGRTVRFYPETGRFEIRPVGGAGEII